MIPPKFSIEDQFPPAGYDQWRALAEADLNGASFERKLVTRTYEGIQVQPVFIRRDWPGETDPVGYPGFHPFVRGSRPFGSISTGWDLRQVHAHPDIAIANQAILADTTGGVTSIILRLDSSARAGLDPDDPRAAQLAGSDGIMAYRVDDLNTVLHDVSLPEVGVALEAGAAFLPAAAALAALWRRRHVPAETACGAFNADPLAALIRDGSLPIEPHQAMAMMADLAVWTAQNLSRVTSVCVATAPYHEAGATAAQDLGIGLATGVEYLRAMTAAGMDVSAAARQIVFSFNLGTHHFLAIAKLRAARRLWARVIEACGGTLDAAAMRLHARTSKRIHTRRDPYVNLLRNTAAVFAAGLGGAEAITSEPFDSALCLPDAMSRRIARNTVLVLQEEAHLHRVIDPAGGSWYLEWLTDQLARRAWEFFQEIERQDGLLAALCSGWVAGQLDSAFAPRAKDIARRKEGITGVSEFPNVTEDPMTRPQPDRLVLLAAASQQIKAARREIPALPALSSARDLTAAALEAATAGATFGQMAGALGFGKEPLTIPPLATHVFAEPFEQLRDASDAWLSAQGHRPRVFLASLGSAAHHTARAAYAKNFFEAGGFEATSGDGFPDAAAAAAAFAASGATVAVICSSDKLYPEVVPQVAPKLKAAGARTVVLAGNPGANEVAWRQVGVDRFIFIGCDVLGVLRDMLHDQGVLQS